MAAEADKGRWRSEGAEERKRWRQRWRKGLVEDAAVANVSARMALASPVKLALKMCVPRSDGARNGSKGLTTQ